MAYRTTSVAETDCEKKNENVTIIYIFFSITRGPLVLFVHVILTARISVIKCSPSDISSLRCISS